MVTMTTGDVASKVETQKCKFFFFCFIYSFSIQREYRVCLSITFSVGNIFEPSHMSTSTVMITIIIIIRECIWANLSFQVVYNFVKVVWKLHGL